MLKTLSTKLAEPRKGVVGVGGGSRAGRDRGKLDGSGIDDAEFDSSEVGDDEVVKKSQNLSKSKKMESGFLTSGARKALTELRQMFIKALILHYLNPKRHIWVETDTSGYAISGVLS